MICMDKNNLGKKPNAQAEAETREEGAGNLYSTRGCSGSNQVLPASIRNWSCTYTTVLEIHLENVLSQNVRTFM